MFREVFSSYSYEYNQHTIILKKLENTSLNYPHLSPDISPQWPGLPISRTKFYGPKDVQHIEVRLLFIVSYGTGGPTS